MILYEDALKSLIGMPIRTMLSGIGEFQYNHVLDTPASCREAVSHSWRNGHVDDTE